MTRPTVKARSSRSSCTNYSVTERCLVAENSCRRYVSAVSAPMSRCNEMSQPASTHPHFIDAKRHVSPFFAGNCRKTCQHFAFGGE